MVKKAPRNGGFTLILTNPNSSLIIYKIVEKYMLEDDLEKFNLLIKITKDLEIESYRDILRGVSLNETFDIPTIVKIDNNSDWIMSCGYDSFTISDIVKRGMSRNISVYNGKPTRLEYVIVNFSDLIDDENYKNKPDKLLHDILVFYSLNDGDTVSLDILEDLGIPICRNIDEKSIEILAKKHWNIHINFKNVREYEVTKQHIDRFKVCQKFIDIHFKEVLKKETETVSEDASNNKRRM